MKKVSSAPDLNLGFAAGCRGREKMTKVGRNGKKGVQTLEYD